MFHAAWVRHRVARTKGIGMAKQHEVETRHNSQPEDADSRASASQVFSVRLPSAIAELVIDEAGQRGVRPSDLLRLAVEQFTRQPGAAGIRANGSGSLRVPAGLDAFGTQNANPVVQPSNVVFDAPDY